MVDDSTKAAIAALRTFPASIIGDELGRTALFDAALVNRSRAAAFAGPVRTAACVAGDISAVLHLLDSAEAGDVLVIDARGYTETAIWGEIMQTTAETIGLAGIVIDGAVRDLAYLRESHVPVFSRAVSPRGPQAGAAGAIGQIVSCGRLPVSPGDIAIGDEDGIVVIRPGQTAGLAERCARRLADEQAIIARVRQGERPRALLGLAPLAQSTP